MTSRMTPKDLFTGPTKDQMKQEPRWSEMQLRSMTINGDEDDRRSNEPISRR